MDVTFDTIKQASIEISDLVVKTQMRKIELPNKTEVYIKEENLQTTGSFKVRGAYFKINNLTQEQRDKGVIAASAGNHAQGVAIAARDAGIKATIVMPSFAPLRKITSTKRLGAEIILVDGGFDDAMSHAKKLAKDNDMTFIHAYDDPYIISGQGTIGLEILNEHPDIDTIIVPIGGGGMIAGIALAVKNINKDVKVIGVEPVAAASMQNSLKLGLPTMLEKTKTLADGVAVGIPGHLAFDICKEHLDDIMDVTEDEIAGAILYLMEEGKMVVEGAGAVAFAAILAGKIDTKNNKVAVVVSGSNIDVSLLARIIDQGLIKNGRKTTISTIVPDRPGNLAHVVSTVSKMGGNILEIQHERSQLDIEIGQVRININFESRNHDHIKEIIVELEKIGHTVIEING